MICQSDNLGKNYCVKSWQYWYCENCQTLFLNPLPKEKELKERYKNYDFTIGFSRELIVRKKARNILKTIKKHVPRAKKLLDIGCGASFLLDEAKRMGFSVTGVEPTQKLAEYAKDNFQISIYNFAFNQQTVQKVPGKFDIIIISHLIEHINKPLVFMKLVDQKLKRNGLLYLETPNIQSWLALMEKQNYTFLTPPDHVCLYSVRSLVRLIERSINRYTVVRLETYSYVEHVVGILKILLGKDNSKKLNTKSIIRKNTRNRGKSTRKEKTFFKHINYILFHKIIAPVLMPFFNLNNKGSIIGFYIRKK